MPVDATRYADGHTVTVLGNTGNLAYSGYTFVGWQTTADGSGTAYAPGGTFTMGAADLTLYALWAGGYAYAVNHNDGSEGTISQYTIGPNGALTPMFTPTVPTGGNDTRNIAVDPLGKYIYVSNPTSETVSQFTIGADGSLTPMSTPTILVGPLAGGQLYYPGSIAVHPSGTWAYVLAWLVTYCWCQSQTLQPILHCHGSDAGDRRLSPARTDVVVEIRLVRCPRRVA